MKPPSGSAARRTHDSVAALIGRYSLGPGAVSQVGSLVEVLTSDPHAPTTVRDPGGVLRDHLADSLVALELEEVRSAASIVDLGAGAGLPGLPLAIALPAATVVLVESNGRKCQFITRAIDAASIGNATVACVRAEAWAAGLNRFDLATARALAPLSVVAEYAAPLLRIGGTLVAWRGRREPGDEAAGAIAARELGLEVRAPLAVEPYPGALHRHLHAMIKTEPTPARFPRRPGIARKRPLGVEGGSQASI